MLLLAAPLLSLLGAAQPTAGPPIHTVDVDRFYALHEATGGKPTAVQLQAYIDGGTEGLRAFAKMRNTSGERIALALEKQPELYAKARECAVSLPVVKSRLDKALRRLTELYPEASLPPVTIAVGRGKPVGTADLNGVMIGLEALCAADFMNPDVADRFVYVIAHEYVHVQQSRFSSEDLQEKLLKAALIEGAAEFVG
ncbi:MAG TPA: lytic murein transglycosylase, partial [Sphingomicrobium sp.]|nr:lytic murein transglycosylase [Sphingomicrobium sp.]